MRIIAIISSLLFGYTLRAQDVRLSVQTGHSSTINSVDYNYDNSLIASASSDNKVVVWHVETGKQYGTFIGHINKVSGLVFHPEKNILYSVSMDSTLIVWDVEAHQQIERIKYDFPLGDVDVSPDGKSLAVSGKALILRDLTAGKDNKIGLFSENLYTAVKFSPKGNWLAMGGTNEKLGYVIDINEKSIIAKFRAAVNDLVFEVGGPSIYYATETGAIVHYDFMRNKVEGTTRKSEWNSFNAIRVTDNYIIGGTDEADIVVYDRDSWRKLVILKAHLQGIRSLDIDKNEKHLISAGLDQRIIMWDLEKQELIRAFQSKIYRINDIQFTENGDEIIVGFANGFVRRTNLIDNTSSSNRSRLTQYQIEKGYEFLLTDITSISANAAHFNMLMLRQSFENEGTYNYLKDISLTWNFESGQLISMEQNSRSERVKNYISQAKKNNHPHTNSLLSPDNLKDETEQFTAEIQNSQLIIRKKSNSGIHLTIELNHTDRVSSVALNPKHNYVATAGWDGMIKFWSLADGHLMSTFGAFGGSDFVYLTPENYYFASKGALENIGFISKGHLFAFDQFDLKYNRPDLVFSELPYVNEKTVENYKRAYEKRLSKLGLTEHDLKITNDIPELHIYGKTGTTSYDGYYECSVLASDKQAELESYHILVNGVPILGRKGKSVNGKSIKTDERIRLTPGRNEIKIYVTNEDGISSFKKTVNVISKEENSSSDLYLVTLGCSKYQQSDFDLNYAEKDASDIIEFFNKSKQFESIHQKKLVNEQVTKSNTEQIKGFLAPAKENDVVLVFVAGHGVLDANLDYYVATYDMDFNDPAGKGIPFEFFDNLLDQTRSRKKLMFIDACHSGEIDKSEVAIDNSEVEDEGDITFRNVGANVKNVNEVNSFELSKIAFADVRESNGSSVLSSAGGGEFAMEGEEWSNGVFTFALLNGLKNGEADLNKDKEILISELYTYLIYKVNKITGGRQTPTSRVENLVNDFRIH